MYAVIETGGKQYRVELGNEIEVEKLDVEAGQTIELERVLLVVDGQETSIGRPVVEGARVSADVVRQDRADKIVVFKYKPKARRRVKKGHRQDLTVLRIADIAFGDRSAAAEARELAVEQAAAHEAAQEEAERKAAADKALAAKLASEGAAAAASTPAPEGKAPARRGRGGQPAATQAKPAAKGTAKSTAKSTSSTPRAAGRGTASRTQAGDATDKPVTRKRAPKKDE